MNLRDCRVFVVDLSSHTFCYRFPTVEIRKPIVRPDMIARVVDFMGYVGAKIEFIEEKPVSPMSEKATLKTHTREQLMAMIADGHADQIHGRTLQNLRNMNAQELHTAPNATAALDDRRNSDVVIQSAPVPVSNRDDEIRILCHELAIRLKARVSNDQQLLAMLEGVV